MSSVSPTYIFDLFQCFESLSGCQGCIYSASRPGHTWMMMLFCTAMYYQRQHTKFYASFQLWRLVSKTKGRWFMFPKLLSVICLLSTFPAPPSQRSCCIWPIISSSGKMRETRYRKSCYSLEERVVNLYFSPNPKIYKRKKGNVVPIWNLKGKVSQWSKMSKNTWRFIQFTWRYRYKI